MHTIFIQGKNTDGITSFPPPRLQNLFSFKLLKAHSSKPNLNENNLKSNVSVVRSRTSLVHYPFTKKGTRRNRPLLQRNSLFLRKGPGQPSFDSQAEGTQSQKIQIRCRVEHIFGYIQTVFTGSFVRSIASSGLRRTTG